MFASIIAVFGLVLADDPAKKDLDALQGIWKIVGKEYMGKTATEEELKKLTGRTVIQGNKKTEIADDAGIETIVSEGTFTLDPTATPRALDLTYTKGDFKGQKDLAIYELKGDTLRVCYAMEDMKQRPTEFAGKLDGRSLLLTYQRVKK